MKCISYNQKLISHRRLEVGAGFRNFTLSDLVTLTTIGQNTLNSESFTPLIRLAITLSFFLASEEFCKTLIYRFTRAARELAQL